MDAETFIPFTLSFKADFSDKIMWDRIQFFSNQTIEGTLQLVGYIINQLSLYII